MSRCVRSLHAPVLSRSCVVLLLCLVLAGCAKRSAETEVHEGEVRTGPHGGAVVSLTREAIQAAGIAVDTAGARQIEVTIEQPGEINLNAERSVDVRPTYPGRVTALHARLGDTVRAGQPLVVIHSNESLSDYEISAPVSGTVVSRPVNVGATVGTETLLYGVADLSTVWLDFPVYVQHLGRIRRGQTVRVRTESGPVSSAVGTISYVGPLLDVDTRTTYARAVLPNRDRRWQPGRLVTAVIAVERTPYRSLSPRKPLSGWVAVPPFSSPTRRDSKYSG